MSLSREKLHSRYRVLRHANALALILSASVFLITSLPITTNGKILWEYGVSHGWWIFPSLIALIVANYLPISSLRKISRAVGILNGLLMAWVVLLFLFQESGPKQWPFSIVPLVAQPVPLLAVTTWYCQYLEDQLLKMPPTVDPPPPPPDPMDQIEVQKWDEAP